MTSRGWRLELDNVEKRKAPLSGDKHKMTWTEGRSLTFWPRQLMTSSRWRLELDNNEKRKAPVKPRQA
ncbi:hypothetical protein GJU40_11410 [Bacillus lacus]|uniref:Uncharacterized protein n=1 Tax=Metabacillus lacus TaxID=1983721 RepID=A0A7X2LYV5_9BACI|nr:hypothetical protein [Metabacillus lacus]MRX72756.1 hypothetical protein [Metabacillus lacus]